MVERKNREGNTRWDRQTYATVNRVKITIATKDSTGKYEQVKKATKSSSFQ